MPTDQWKFRAAPVAAPAVARAPQFGRRRARQRTFCGGPGFALRVAYMSESTRSLDRSLVRGLAWTGGMKWLTQPVSWAVTIMVARFLSPGDYGLFGMATIYVGFAQFVGEAGLAAVVIQSRDLDEETAAQLGGAALFLGMVLCILSSLGSGLIAQLFADRNVQPLIIALSVTFVLRGVQVLPRALLARSLRFRDLAWIDAYETIGAAVTTLVLAASGAGYWALVIGISTGAAISGFLCLIYQPHRLALPRNGRALMNSMALGLHVLGSQIAWYLYSNADFAVVGRLLGRASLGAYTFGWSFANLPVDRVTGLVGRVTPSVFAAVQRDHAALRRYLCAITEGLALVTMPACIGLALVAEDLTRSVLGNAWAGAIIPLRILAVYAAFRCVIALFPQILVFTGHARRNFQFSVLAAVALPPLFVIGSRWGTTGVALAWITAYPVIMMLTYVRYSLRIIGLSWTQLLWALWPAASSTAVMSAVVGGLLYLLPHGDAHLVRLIMLVLGGAFAYLVTVLFVHGRRVRRMIDTVSGDPLDDDRPSLQPVHQTSAATQHRRLLLISYHFPPSAAVGALRWQKMVKYAAQRGWGIDVIALHPDAIANAEASRLHDLPAGVRVYGIPDPPVRLGVLIDRIWNRARPFVRRGRTRASRVNAGTGSQQGSLSRREALAPRSFRVFARLYWSVIEDMRGRHWSERAERLAANLLAEGRHRAIISCGPPHFAHIAGAHLAATARLPLVVDFRDPWSLIQRLPEATASPFTLVAAAVRERHVMRQAALIVANTEPLAMRMRRKYPRAASRVIAIPNGYDDDPLPPPQRGRCFSIVYTGTIYLDRSPQSFFRAAALAIGRLRVSPAEFRIVFMGAAESYNGVPVTELARSAHILDFLHVHGPGTRDAALTLLSEATMLLVLPQDSDLAIPAKLFEYMRFDAWMLVLAERGSATATLLDGTSADVLPAGDVERIADTLVERYRQHIAGLTATRLAIDPRFSRRARADAFLDALDTVTGSAHQFEPPQRFEDERPGIVATPNFAPALAPANANEVSQRP